MKTAICPISSKKINENVARGNALLTVAFLTVYLLTGNIIFIAFLLIDFLLRGLELSKFSPFTFVSRGLNLALNISPKRINAGPKVFAARIGAVFGVLILTTALAGWNTTAFTLTVVFGVCAFLEAFFAFCVACQIYPYLYRAFYKW